MNVQGISTLMVRSVLTLKIIGKDWRIVNQWSRKTFGGKDVILSVDFS